MTTRGETGPPGPKVAESQRSLVPDDIWRVQHPSEGLGKMLKNVNSLEWSFEGQWLVPVVFGVLATGTLTDFLVAASVGVGLIPGALVTASAFRGGSNR